MPRKSLPVAPPLEGNDQLIAALITAGFAIALIVLILLRGQLDPADRWWIWVTVTGCGIGVFGLLYAPHLKRSRNRATQRRNDQRRDAQES